MIDRRLRKEVSNAAIPRRATRLILLLLVALLRCTSETGTGGSSAESFEIPAGRMTVRVHRKPYQMEVLGPDGRPLVVTPDIAAVPSDGSTRGERALDSGGSPNLSPMPFLPHAFEVGEEPRGRWYSAVEALEVRKFEDRSEVVVRAETEGDPTEEAMLSIVLRSEDPSHLVIEAEAPGVEDVTYQTGAFRLDPDEHFFGLGLQYDSIDSRGKLRLMHLGLGVDLTDQIQNHAPIPFYISSRGYGLFVEDKGPGYFDMGRTRDSAYGFKYRANGIKFHLFWGPEPLDVIEAYTAATGRPPLNPDYLFGHLHWRNENRDESEIYADADGIRAHGIPTSSIMVDAPWQTSYSTFRWNECPSGCQFKDARAVIDACHAKGYAFYVWTAEFVNRWCEVEAPGMVEDNSAEFDYAKGQGFLVPIFGFVWEYPWWHQNGAMVNFLNPRAYQWYASLARYAVGMGLQGFKMDGGEYPGTDTLGLKPLGAFDFGGYGDPRTSQHDYRVAYHQLFWDVARELNGDLGIATVRCAAWGEQSHVSYFWPGDLDSGWGFDLGLPADIVGGSTLGAAGFPYYGSNTGGFSHYEVNPELMARWAEYSAFRPIFESPRDGTQQLWEEYPNETFEIYRRYAILHTRLLPYMKAYALEAHRTGHPILRMLPLHYLDDPATYGRNFDYLLGDWLLVAPVCREGAVSREVYLPRGRWVHYWTNEIQEGPASVTKSAEVGEIPVFAKAGAIIPLLDPSVQTLWPTDDPAIVDHLDKAHLLWVDVFPSGSSRFALADGTTFSMSESDGGFSIGVAQAPLARTYSLRAIPATYGGGKPSAITGPSGPLVELASRSAWESAPRGWYFEVADGNLWIRDACDGGEFTVDR